MKCEMKYARLRNAGGGQEELSSMRKALQKLAKKET